MGEKVAAGQMTYMVLESQWKHQLGEATNPRIPERTFLLIRIQATNSGGAEQIVPGLTLEDSNGNSYPESTDGTGVTGWLGMVRNIGPAMTDEGWVLFDVPTNSYNLKITAPGTAEGSDRTYQVKIPLQLEAPTQ